MRIEKETTAPDPSVAPDGEQPSALARTDSITAFGEPHKRFGKIQAMTMPELMETRFRVRPVVIDGFISAVAALCAVRLCPRVRDYLVPSHASFEIGYRLAMEAMRLEPLFLLGMRLGEGSGCPLAFQVLSAACAVMNDMATFDEAGIDDGYLDEIREGDKFTVEGAQ